MNVMEIMGPDLSQIIDLAKTNQKFVAPVFNVQGYGAVGNGDADDLTKIQSAIDAANTAGGGLVVFPPGKYRVTAALKLYSNITLIGYQAEIMGDFSVISSSLIYGYGTYGSSVALTGNIAIGDTTINAPSTGLSEGDIIQFSDNRYSGKYAREVCVVKSVTATTITLHSPISLEYLTANSAVYNKISGIENVKIDGLTISCSPTASIDQIVDIRNAKDIVVQNCTFKKLRSNLNHDNLMAVYLYSCFNALVQNNVKYGVGDSTLDSGNVVAATFCSDILITKNRGYNCYFGYGVYGSTHSKIFKNIVRSNQQSGARGAKVAYSYYCEVEGNQIVSTDTGVKLEDSGRCIIRSNFLINCGNNNAGNGINCSNSYASANPDFMLTLIEGNIIKEMHGNAIYVLDNSRRFDIINNIIDGGYGRGIIVESIYSRIIGNRIYNNGFLGIDFNPYFATVSDNHVEDYTTGLYSFRFLNDDATNANLCTFTNNYANLAVSVPANFKRCGMIDNNRITGLNNNKSILVPLLNGGASGISSSSGSYVAAVYGLFEGTDSYPPSATYTLVTLIGVSDVATQLEFSLTDDPTTVGYGSTFIQITGRNIQTVTLSSLPATRTKIQGRLRSTDNVNAVTVWEAYIKVEW